MRVELPSSLWPTLHGLAAGESWPPSSERAADLLVAQAEREGLLPLLFADDSLPGAVRASLDRNRAWLRIHARRAEILLDALVRLCRLLEGEPFLLLKGADYRHRLYPRPELRPMKDIDVLVPIGRAEAAAERLRAAGLKQLFPGGAVSRLASYYERVFLVDDVAVEIHHSFVQRPRHHIDYAAVWDRRVPLESEPFRAARLSDVDALAYHALAMAKDEFSLPLARYVDLWLMLRQAPGIVGEAASRAREWGAVRALYGALRQACRLFPEFGELALQPALEDLLRPSVRRFLDRWVLPEPREYGKGKNMTRGVELWRKFWLMDSLGRRAAFGLYSGYAALAGRLVQWSRRA